MPRIHWSPQELDAVSIMRTIKPSCRPEGHLLFHRLPLGTVRGRSFSPLHSGGQGLHGPHGAFLSFSPCCGLLETLGTHLQTPRASGNLSVTILPCRSHDISCATEKSPSASLAWLGTQKGTFSPEDELPSQIKAKSQHFQGSPGTGREKWLVPYGMLTFSSSRAPLHQEL